MINCKYNAENKTSQTDLEQLALVMLEDMFKLVRERLCVSSDEDEETRDGFERALCESYSDNLVAIRSSPETPTSVLPNTRKMDIKTCYSPPSLLPLRVEAVRKLNPIDLKHLSFHIFPHPFDQDSRRPIKLNKDERRCGMDVVSGDEVVDHSEVANTPPPPPPPPPPSPPVDLESEAMSETSPPPPPPPPPPASRNTVSSPPPPRPPPASRNTVSSPPPPPPTPPASRNTVSSPPPPPPPLSSRNTVSSPPPPPPLSSRNTVSSPSPPPPPLASRNIVSSPPPPPPPPTSRNTISSPPPPPLASSRNTLSSPPPSPPPSSRNTISSPPPPPPPLASRNTMSSPPPPPPPVHFNSRNPASPPPPPPPMTSRNAAPPLMSMVNGTFPPPPPPPRIAGTNKKATTKLKRSLEMGNLFRRLKGKIEGSSLEGKSSGKKGRIGTCTGGKQGMAEALAQITERSSYYKQIEEDVKSHSKSIKEVKAAIASFQTSDMDELIKFHKYVDSHLEKLTDESKVLARFEDFPSKKLEALRMAAALYLKLDLVATTLQNWPIASPFGELLDKVEIYFNKIKREIDALERTKDEDSKKFRSHKINFDFSIIIRIKELMVDVSSSCMELALKEIKDFKEKEREEFKSQKRKKGSSSGDILWKAFQFAFRVYTFAGGQDGRAEKLTRELAREIEADPCQ